MKKESYTVTVSRRGFLKGAAAVGATAALYGCSKNDSGEYYQIGDDGKPTYPDLTPDGVYFGTGNHNCGGRCLLTAHVKNGRIIRMLTDEQPYASDGSLQDPDSFNNTETRACSKCRAYKDRLYHPGRLKYPLKQTIKRGDLSGFVRITWDQALDEITKKHFAIREKYGPESIYSVYACGSYTGQQGGSYSGLWVARNNTFSISTRMLKGFSPYYNNYSFHQQGFFGTGYTGYNAGPGTGTQGATCSNDIAGNVNTVVLWGANILSTVNPRAQSVLYTLKEVRDRGGQVIFIGPELSDEGVTCATQWIQSKPYTDGALILGMLHEMIINTFNSDGSLKPKAERWLDIDFLDAAVYGFFDSPKYWVKTDTANSPAPKGTILFNESLIDSDYTEVNEVPSGKSLSAYIMGNDDRLTLANYADGNTYTAKEFARQQPKRNLGVCSYSVNAGVANTIYNRKKDYLKPKDASWASDITGIPVDTIKALAKMYCTESAHPIYSEWCGGFQKQAEGVINMFSLQVLGIITQTYGRTGETIARGIPPKTVGVSGKNSLPNMNLNQETINTYNDYDSTNMPFVSCAMWHNAVKFAFGDVLKDNGYTAQYLPDLKESEIGTGKVYHDDGGVKALVKWKRNADDSLVAKDSNGYYVPETDASGNVIYSGYRFILNTGGNILINQHMNSNDSKDMFERIPVGTKDPSNPDDLCVVSFDNFLTPSPRWSDYVLPAATNWEMDNRQGIDKGNTIITPVVSQPPGESLSTWNFTCKYIEYAEKNGLAESGSARDYVGVDSAGATFNPADQYIDKYKRAYQKSNYANDPASRFNGKTFDEALRMQYIAQTPVDTTPTPPSKTSIRRAIDEYLALPTGGGAGSIEESPFLPEVVTLGQTGYGNQYPTTDVDPIPQQSGKFHVYSDLFVWQYVNRFKAWHGWINDVNQRGQKNVDAENDPIVYPIPMYFAYEDYFMEAYGGNLPSDPFLLTTSHDRYRAHSSYSATPLLRELTHRLYKGKMYSGNDWGSYALSEADGGSIPRLNKAIQDKDLAHASWSEIWMNADDAAERGIADGDLLQVENPIGAVRVIARLTNRCVRGFVGLHQGCWYDPDPEDGVDDGGNCNTLMASKPSRVDHGNGQQSAMVSIRKVELNW